MAAPAANFSPKAVQSSQAEFRLAKRIASLRDPTASAASADTVIAVPSAITSVEITRPVEAGGGGKEQYQQRSRTGPTPTASASAQARRQDQSPFSAAAAGMWAWPQSQSS